METNQYLKINEILQTKRISLPELSNLTGIKTENLHTIFKKNTTIKTLNRIAGALGYRLKDLVKQRISAHGYLSFSINGGKCKNDFFDDIETIQKVLRSTIKKIRDMQIPNEEINIHKKFIEILENRGYEIDDVVEAVNAKNNSRTTKQNLITSLTSNNPTLKTLIDICEVVDIELSELLASNTDYEIKGVVVINGDVITLNALTDLERTIGVIAELINNRISDAEIDKMINDILSVEDHESETNESYQISDLNFSEDDLRMDKESIIDSTKELCYSFRKKGDIRNGKLLNLSNMLKGYPFEFLGHSFNDSECAYISGCYTSNNEHCLRIQNELSVYDKGGYNAKAEYQKAKVEESINTPHKRKDWNTFNLQWMLLVLWYKVNNNKGFRDMLMQIPLNAHIIEDTSYHKGNTAGIWGCKNKDLTKLRQSKRMSLRSKLIERGVFKLKILSYAEQIIDNRINNIGIWIGQNATGKALKLCQIALVNEELPPINIELLNDSNIYWFGHRIEFFIEDNTIKYKKVGLIKEDKQESNVENYKVVIAGSRNFDNYELLRDKCNEFIGARTNIEIVSGGAKGADRLGERYAIERGFQLVQISPNWALGRSAGAIRNTEMAEYAHAALIFWDGKSKGSNDMIKKCKQKNLDYKVILF